MTGSGDYVETTRPYISSSDVTRSYRSIKMCYRAVISFTDRDAEGVLSVGPSGSRWQDRPGKISVSLEEPRPESGSLHDRSGRRQLRRLQWFHQQPPCHPWVKQFLGERYVGKRYLGGEVSVGGEPAGARWRIDTVVSLPSGSLTWAYSGLASSSSTFSTIGSYLHDRTGRFMNTVPGYASQSGLNGLPVGRR